MTNRQLQKNKNLTEEAFLRGPATPVFGSTRVDQGQRYTWNSARKDTGRKQPRSDFRS